MIVVLGTAAYAVFCGLVIRVLRRHGLAAMDRAELGDRAEDLR